MISYGKVRSSQAPKSIEITSSQVFIAKNISKYEETFDDYIMQGYEYDYVGYDKDEYILLLHSQILDTQMALCDIYESIGGDK